MALENTDPVGLNINPSIPLQAGRNLPQFGPDYNALLTMQRIQQAQQVQQAQNALKSLYSNQQNFDPKTLQPTPEAMAGLMATNPAAGMDLTNNLVALQQKRALFQSQNADAMKEWRGTALEGAKDALDVYDAELKKGNPNAMQVAQEEYTKNFNSWKSSGAPPNLVSMASPTFDPVRIRRNLMTTQQQEAQEKQANQFDIRTDYGKSPPVEYRVYNDGRTTDVTGKAPYSPTGVGEAKAKDEEIMTAQTTEGKPVDLMRSATGGWIDAVTKQPIDPQSIKPGSLQKKGVSRTSGSPAGIALEKYLQEHPDATAEDIAKFNESQRPARSGAAAAVRKYMQENPNASATDIASFNAWQRETSAGAQAFGTGTQGNLTRAQNVAIDHLGFLSDDLVPALKNGEIRALNSLKNWAQTEFGYEGPVDFNFAKGIVSQEVNKAIVNVGAGTELERKNLADSLSASNSPEQLSGVISSAKRLMAGQLRGLQQQYVDVSVPPDQRNDKQAVERAQKSFEQKLSPRTTQELSLTAPAAAPAKAATTQPAPASSGGIPEVKTPADAAALPPGTRYRRPDGTIMVR